MELEEWPDLELVALAEVYIKRKQLTKAQVLRAELERRLVETEQPHLRLVYEQLEQTKVVTLTSRVVSLFRHAS